MTEEDPTLMRGHWDDHVLDRLYFRRYRLCEQFPNQLIAPRTNARAMSKTDNYNKYDYSQASGEKHTG